MSEGQYRDVVIETLAASEAGLQEQVATLTTRAEVAEMKRDAYRLVAVQAIYRICDLRAEHDALTERYQRALEDARGLRVQLLQEGSGRAA